MTRQKNLLGYVLRRFTSVPTGKRSKGSESVESSESMRNEKKKRRNIRSWKGEESLRRPGCLIENSLRSKRPRIV